MNRTVQYALSNIPQVGVIDGSCKSNTLDGIHKEEYTLRMKLLDLFTNSKNLFQEDICHRVRGSEHHVTNVLHCRHQFSSIRRRINLAITQPFVDI